MKNILVIEPICRDFEHARFNSALLATILVAFPNATIEFWGEIRHNNNTIELLKYMNIHNLRITFKELKINWSKMGWARYLQEKYFCRNVFEHSAIYDILLFSSMTSSLIIAIKEYIERSEYKAKVIGVPHSVLAGIAAPSKRIWNWPIGIKNALRKKTPNNFHLISLSQTVYNSIAEHFQVTNWHLLEHPYIFDFQPTICLSLNRDKINFGILGAVRQGFDEYYKIAVEIKKEFSNSQFHLVGHLSSKKYKIKRAAGVVNNVSEKPITYGEYNELMKKLHYIIWLPNPNHYRYAVSCTVLDAFNYGKPGLYLTNRLIEEYTKSMGDIGYLCNSIDEVKSTIVKILNNFPETTYLKQIDNIVRNRKKFDPVTVANQFKNIVQNIYDLS